MKRKIAYIENSLDLSHPSDRRRFAHFSRKYGVEFEFFDYESSYDVVIVTVAADFYRLNKYLEIFPDTNIIFDYCDNLLSDNFFKKVVRPFYEAFKSKSIYALTPYNGSVIKILKAANVIICGSAEQQKDLLRYNDDVEVIPDFVILDSVFRKENYTLTQPGQISILWEGLSGGLRKVSRPLFSLASELNLPVKFLIVTDPELYLVGDRYLKTSTKKFIENLVAEFGVHAEFMEWSKENLELAAKQSDFSVIYIPHNNQTMRSKPENKLVLLSSMGLPVLVSKTDSYARFITDCDADLLDASILTAESLYKICVEEEIRRSVGESFGHHARSAYSEAKILARWEALFYRYAG